MNDDEQGRGPHGGATHDEATTDQARSDDTTAPRSGLDKAFDSIRRLQVWRRSDDKWIGGVCSGIADRFGVDPLIVRAALVLLGVLGGIGVTLYLLAWTLLPDEDGDIAAELAVRDGDTSSIILTAVTAVVLLSGFPWWWGHGVFGWNFPWLIVVVVGLVWWFWSAARGGAPGALGPEQQRARRERVARRSQEWGEKAAARSQEWTDKVTAKTTEGDARRRAARAQARAARRRSGGVVLALITIGLALVAYGALEWMGPQWGVTGSWDAVALAGALAVFGAVLVVAGLWGRRAGLVGFLAIVTALVTVGSAITPDSLQFGGRVGTERWSPSVVSTTADYRVMIGDGTLDLTRLPADGLDQAVLDTSVGIGGLTVIVPDGLTVHLKAHVSAGEIKLPRGFVSDDGQTRTSNGLGVSRDVVIGDGPTEVVLKARVGTGQIRVDQQS